MWCTTWGHQGLDRPGISMQNKTFKNKKYDTKVSSIELTLNFTSTSRRQENVVKQFRLKSVGVLLLYRFGDCERFLRLFDHFCDLKFMNRHKINQILLPSGVRGEGSCK